MFELTPFTRHTMSRYNPFSDMEDLERSFFGRNPLAEFKTDIKDNGSEYVLEADLPGFDKENIHVDVDGGYLTISAERHAESEEKDKKGNTIHSERSFGSFSRSFDVSGVNEETISAQYKDGVLKLTMPKKEKDLPTSHRLEIQ